MSRLVQQIRAIVIAYVDEFGPEAIWIEIGGWLGAAATFWLVTLLLFAIAPMIEGAQ